MLLSGCFSRIPSSRFVLSVKLDWRSILQFNLSRKASPRGQVVEESVKVIKKELDQLLQRRWLMQQPDTKISRVLISHVSGSAEVGGSDLLGQLRFKLQNLAGCGLEHEQENVHPMFYVTRDDLLHPVLGGNKLRKLDALLAQLEDYGATDVVTCGGCQSAHTAALAYACAERGIRAHLLLRGEKPTIPTGYNLLSNMYGITTYVPRSEYADRPTMFEKHGKRVAGKSGSIMWLDEPETFFKDRPSSEKKVIVVKEGAGDAVALLGLVRLVHYLSQPSVFGSYHDLHIIVDSGTGTTAIGLALGIALLELPWKVVGVMLADTVEGYEAQKLHLVSSFCEQFSFSPAEVSPLPLVWRERWQPRKFGKIFPGEVRVCQSIAQQTGILLDPIYTLAGWEVATRVSLEGAIEGHNPEKVLMIHTGGTLGLFGLAQRHPAEFV